MNVSSALLPDLSFVGGGHMAQALIKGLITQGLAPHRIKVIEPNRDTRSQLTTRFGVLCFATVAEPALASTVIVLAVKPPHMREAVASIAPWLSQQLVLSVAAGIRARDIGRWLNGYSRIVRAMPNTPAQIGLGAIGIAGLGMDDASDLQMADSILSTVGLTVRVPDETLLDAVTALSGSGPAYVLYFLEGLIASGTALGLPPETAQRLAIQTVLGTAQLAQSSAEPPARLREHVTSKGGTTAAALQVMQHRGLNTILHEAISAAARRARELADDFGTDDIT